jgi:hypothetical protein
MENCFLLFIVNSQIPSEKFRLKIPKLGPSRLGKSSAETKSGFPSYRHSQFSALSSSEWKTEIENAPYGPFSIFNSQFSIFNSSAAA